MNTTRGRVTRFAAFKRVLAEAAQSPPLSPAVTAYYAATSDAERRAAHAGMTTADSEAVIAAAMKAYDTRMNAVIADRRRADEGFEAWNAADNSAHRATEDARIAALPPTERHRSELLRATLTAIRKISTWLARGFVACFIIGNIFAFIFSLIYNWLVWALLFGFCFAMFSVIMIAAQRRVLGSVLKALPTAVHAAITNKDNELRPHN